MNRMKNYNLVYKIKKEKTEKRCGGSAVNGKYFTANLCIHYKGLTLIHRCFASPQFKYKLTLALKVHFSSRNTTHVIKNSFFHGLGSLKNALI